MALMLEYLTAITPVVSPGIFIPNTALPGFSTLELDASSPGKDSKFVLSFLNRLYTYINETGLKPLGLNMTKPNPVGAGTNLVNQNFGLVHTYALDYRYSTINSIPIATTGLNANNLLAFNNVFSGSIPVTSGDTPGAGIVIPDTELVDYGAVTVGSYGSGTNLNNDNRLLVIGIARMLSQRLELKSASNPNSAIIQASRNAPTIFTPPIDFTAATNPTSGIPSADLPFFNFVNTGYSFTIQLKLDDINQSFDVNVPESVVSNQD